MSVVSHSWEGEDVLVRKITKDVLGLETGFYVDIGAHHPFNLSNTAMLYSLGWRGINVDANPGSMRLFDEHRPEDINLEVGVSDKIQNLSYSIFSAPELNGFLSNAAIERHRQRGYALIDQVDVPCTTISEIIKKYAGGRHVDLLNIDIEGFDDAVIRFINPQFRPSLIIAEILGTSDMSSVINSPVARFLQGSGYALFSRLHFSCFFIDRPFLETRG